MNVEEIDIKPNDMKLLCRERWLNDPLMNPLIAKKKKERSVKEESLIKYKRLPFSH